jgi:hypothetical protein
MWYDTTPTNPQSRDFHAYKGQAYLTSHLDQPMHESSDPWDMQAGYHRAATISRFDTYDGAGGYTGPHVPIIDKSNRPGEPTWDHARTRYVKPH